MKYQSLFYLALLGPASTFAGYCRPPVDHAPADTALADTAPATPTTPTTTWKQWATSAPDTSTFNCPVNGFSVAITDGQPALYSVNLATGQQTVIKDPLGDGTPINAIGYNVLDNTLYGQLDSSPPQLIQISAQGEIKQLLALPFAPGQIRYSLGDVDEKGDYWLSDDGRFWIQVRISTLTIVDQGTTTAPPTLSDWAYVPGGGNALYSIDVDVAGGAFLYRFDRTTHTWTQVGTGYGNLYPATGYVGALYATSDGFLYGSENLSGMIYRFSLDGNTSRFISTGPPALSNDGAHCINNVGL